MTFFRWIATAAAAVALLGCGGQDGDTDAAAAVSVQVATVPAGLKVTASLASSAAPVVHETTQYTFSATIASGPHAGQNLSGTLVLQADDAAGSGSLQVEGTLVSTARLAAKPAALATFDSRSQTLRATLRARVEAASADLLTAMKAGSAGSALTAAQSQALQQFTQSFTALGTKYRGDVAALNALLLAESTDGGDATVDEDLEVSGSADATGHINLNLVLADASLLLVSGTTAANGSMSGTLTGPAGDLGTWTATAQPMPTAAAAGNVAAGLAKYSTYCANCHTANVRRNEFNVVVGSDVVRLNAALAGIGSMTFLDPVLSVQDRLDIAAYVLSAR